VCQLQETLIELQKLHEQLARKEMQVVDDCPSKETTSLAMASQPQFYLQASMHSNNENFLA
jgi:hypothetical protein